MNRLKQKELADYRNKMFKEQHEHCTLCKDRIHDYQACLDHDHKTGHVRTVLCKACNTAEGKILGWAIRSGSRDPSFFIKQLARYWEVDYTDNPLHPTHLTPTEKELKKLTKHQKKLKTQRGRDRVQVKIDALLAMEDRE